MDSDLHPRYFARSSPCTTGVPETRLLFAALLDAIIQLRSRDARKIIEAENWIRNDEITDSLFSFDNICDALGIESNYLAAGLLACRDCPTNVEQRALLRQSRASRMRIALSLRRTRAATASGVPSVNERPPNDMAEGSPQTRQPHSTSWRRGPSRLLPLPS